MEANLRKTGCQDITAEFLESIKKLDLGELLHSSHFTLVDAMSAIELMDVKMDSGIVLKRVNRKILSLDQAVKAGTVKINNLEPRELMGIIDHTYSCLCTWMDGYPLWANVMTSLYLHDPDIIEDQTLRVFSQSILKLVNSIDKLVYQICCIEEEDFILNLGKFKLAPNLSDHKALSNLESLCQQYEKVLSTPKTDTPKSTSTTTAAKQDTSSSDQPAIDLSLQLQNINKFDLQSLIHRLRFTYHFYSSFFILSRCLPKNYQEEYTTSAEEQSRTVRLVLQSARECEQHLDKCYNYLNLWQKSIHLGIQPSSYCSPENQENSLVNDDYPTIMGFDPLINIMLLTPAYPRCPYLKDRATSIRDFKILVDTVRNFIRRSKSFDRISLIESMEFLKFPSRYFSGTNHREVCCVIIRSFAQALYTPNRSVTLLQDKLLQSLNDFFEPLVKMMKKCPDKKIALNNFLNESAKTFAPVINLYGHNLARQNERLPDIIASIKNLHYSAVMMNAEFNSVIIYSWTMYQLARFCIKYIITGIELELFSTHEYPYVYWYLYDILYRTEKEHLEMAKQYVIDNVTIESNHKKLKQSDQRRRIIESTIYHEKYLYLNKAFRFLSGGIFLLTHGLKLQGKIRSVVSGGITHDKQPQNEDKLCGDKYTTEEICFNRRFRSLIGTGVYQTYQQMLSSLTNLDYIYREAAECFEKAKKMFDNDESIEDGECAKVCKKNMIAAQLLVSKPNLFKDRKVDFSFDLHPSFPTILV